MGNPRAKENVVLRDPADGQVKVFEQGDQLPNWALEQITNPDVADQDAGETEKKSAPARKAPTKARTRASRAKTVSASKASAESAGTASTSDTSQVPAAASDTNKS